MSTRWFYGGLVSALFVTTMLVTVPEEYRVVQGGGEDYLVRADQAGLRFISDNGGRIDFGRPKVVTENETLCARATAPVMERDGIIYDHGTWEERYQLNQGFLQQMFLLRKPIQGATEVRIPILSELKPKTVGPSSVAFFDDKGRVRVTYEDALAMDAGGNIQDLGITSKEGEITIHVPAEYLATAQYPILIDPAVGSSQTLSDSGEIWRSHGVDIVAATSTGTEQVYFAVYHYNVTHDHPSYETVFFGPDANPGVHWPAHNIITGSQVGGRALSISNTGTVTLGEEHVFAPINVDPLYPFVQYNPRVTWNAINNQYMITWTEGNWEVIEHNGVTDAITYLNPNPMPEYLQALDSNPPNATIVGAQFSIGASPTYTVALNAGSPFEITRTNPYVPGASDNPINTNAPPDQYRACLYSDVSWDGNKYIVVWQTLESPTLIVTLEAVEDVFEYRHVFWTQSRTQYSLFNNLGARILINDTLEWGELTALKSRLFLNGPPASDTILDGLLPQNLLNQLVYDFVPTDQQPRVSSIIHPGADNDLSTPGDNTNVGSMMVASVSSLVFNQPKSRVRARFLDANQTQASSIFDVYNSEGQIIQRANVAAGCTKTGDPMENSHFLVTFLDVKDIVFKGNVGNPSTFARAVEFIGDVKARMSQGKDGLPAGPAIDVASGDGSNLYMTPSAAWSRQGQQYVITWVRTDTTLYNPQTLARPFFPGYFAMLGSTSQPVASLSSLYPETASAFAPYVDPNDPFSASLPHHSVIVGQENDFGLTYYQPYKFDPVPPVPDPVLSVDPIVLTFASQGPDYPAVPSSQNVLVTNTGPTGSFMVFDITYPNGQPDWLAVSPESAALTSGQSIPIVVSINGPPPTLPAGSTSTTFTVTSPTATGSPILVTVILEVAIQGGSGTGTGGTPLVTGTGGEGLEGTDSCGLLGAEVALGLLALGFFRRRRRNRR